MDYILAIGQRTYSSWSLRGWLLFSAFDIPHKTVLAQMYSPKFRELLDAEFAPARTVPALKAGEGDVIWDTLAIAETLHERHPDARIWPEDPSARAFARSLAAEMHSGFSALRGVCPMNMEHQWQGFVADEKVDADLARLEELWSMARQRFGANGPWLFGEYSAADAFFAPVAARVAGYALKVGPVSEAYVAEHLAETRFRQWRAMGRAAQDSLNEYDMGLPTGPWPGPATLSAKAVEGADAINDACPFSGKPVAADGLVQIGDTVVGMCNSFCRDKTAADPEAWPQVMALLR